MKFLVMLLRIILLMLIKWLSLVKVVSVRLMMFYLCVMFVILLFRMVICESWKLFLFKFILWCRYVGWSWLSSVCWRWSGYRFGVSFWVLKKSCLMLFMSRLVVMRILVWFVVRVIKCCLVKVFRLWRCSGRCLIIVFWLILFLLLCLRLRILLLRLLFIMCVFMICVMSWWFWVSMLLIMKLCGIFCLVVVFVLKYCCYLRMWKRWSGGWLWLIRRFCKIWISFLMMNEFDVLKEIVLVRVVIVCFWKSLLWLLFCRWICF